MVWNYVPRVLLRSVASARNTLRLSVWMRRAGWPLHQDRVRQSSARAHGLVRREAASAGKPRRTEPSRRVSKVRRSAGRLRVLWKPVAVSQTHVLIGASDSVECDGATGQIGGAFRISELKQCAECDRQIETDDNEGSLMSGGARMTPIRWRRARNRRKRCSEQIVGPPERFEWL